MYIDLFLVYMLFYNNIAIILDNDIKYLINVFFL